jgi:hypothetical protein
VPGIRRRKDRLPEFRRQPIDDGIRDSRIL